MSDVAQLMRAANPVPDSEAALTNDDFDALLLLTQSRSGNMDVQELTKPVEPEKKPRSGWLVAAVAFAVVIVFVGAVMLLASPADELPPATTPPTTQAAPPTTEAPVEEAAPTTVAPVVVAEPTVSTEQMATIAAYQSTWNAGDEEGFRLLFVPGAVREDTGNFEMSGDVDRILFHMRGRRAMGLQQRIENCRPVGDVVSCTVFFDGLVPTAMSYMPWRDTYNFTFEGGKIAHIETKCVICWDQATELRFYGWAESVEPGLSTLLGDNYQLVDSEEQGVLWLEWAPKWQEAGRP